MPKRALSESALALFAGSKRAAAIYGDLVEMGATRGEAWFMMAYARTLLALTWRTYLGFVGALAVVAMVNRLEFGNEWQKFVFFHFPRRWRHIPHGNQSLPVYNFVYTALSAASSTGCLLSGYAAVRYGVRDRMVRAAFSISLLLTCAMSLTTEWPVSLSFIALAAATTGCAMLIAPWRAAFTGAIVSMAGGTVITGCLLWCQRVLVRQALMHHRPFRPLSPHIWIGFSTNFLGIVILDFVVVAYTTARVRRWFSDKQQNVTA